MFLYSPVFASSANRHSVLLMTLMCERVNSGKGRDTCGNMMHSSRRRCRAFAIDRLGLAHLRLKLLGGSKGHQLDRVLLLLPLCACSVCCHARVTSVSLRLRAGPALHAFLLPAGGDGERRSEIGVLCVLRCAALRRGPSEMSGALTDNDGRSSKRRTCVCRHSHEKRQAPAGGRAEPPG